MRKELLQEIQKDAERLVMLCRNAALYADDESAELQIMNELARLQEDAEAYLSQAITAVNSVATTAVRLITHAEAEKRKLLGDVASIRGSISQLVRKANEEVAWKRRRQAATRS